MGRDCYQVPPNGKLIYSTEGVYPTHEHPAQYTYVRIASSSLLYQVGGTRSYHPFRVLKSPMFYQVYSPQ